MGQTDIHNELKSTLESIAAISPDAVHALTWAQRVTSPANPTQMAPKAPIKSHTITVKITEPSEKEQLMSLPYVRIVEKLGEPDVLAMKRMESRDVKLFLAGGHEKVHMERNKERTKRLRAFGSVAVKHHQALVHGVLMPQGDVNNEEDIKGMEEVIVARLHPGIKIVKVGWLKGAKAREGKKASTLIVSIPKEHLAKEIVAKGSLYQYALLTAGIPPPPTEPRNTSTVPSSVTSQPIVELCLTAIPVRQ
ncbi:hypothetical protein K470DRAFT_271565 [Piedraia hortae CBS 480.64]|uniref:Uncharacterized protein n=1 Tax=Piedraia hortae CBS 480.64 TaxID=1314780 RepID=A0A6A7BVZ6_9PEZI|nr:hypothetical protein K470DRAFT_271565 [Piedraia hortae CBS 480.64]